MHVCALIFVIISANLYSAARQSVIIFTFILVGLIASVHFVLWCVCVSGSSNDIKDNYSKMQKSI